MVDVPKDETKGSASPPRNFTLSFEARLSALATGPRAYMRRRRRIEDLEAELVQDVINCKDLDLCAPPERLVKKVQVLNELIDRHNRYFPIEANLPLDPKTGCMLELGRPWAPIDNVDLSVFVARAKAIANSP